MEVTDLITALSGPTKTMADDVLRLQLTIDPALSKAAFRLFGSRGTWVAMTVLGKEGDAIEGASAGVETMAKGKMRLFVDVDPRHAARAFDAFGAPDTLMALAAIKPEHLRQREAEKQQRLEARGHRPSFLAVQWCRTEIFQHWLQSDPEMRLSWDAVLHTMPAPVSMADVAAEVVRRVCSLESRNELDHDADARSRFDRNVRRPFLEWQQRQTTTQGA